MTTQVEGISRQSNAQSGSKRTLYQRDLFEILTKLDPRQQLGNPVMFTVFVSSIVITISFIWMLRKQADGKVIIGMAVAWLWLTFLLVNIAAILADGYSYVRAKVLRRVSTEVMAKRLDIAANKDDYRLVPTPSLNAGDVVLVEAGETIPADGYVIEGQALVDECIFTGEEIPVPRKTGEAYNAVIGGTGLLSGWLVIRVRATLEEGLLNQTVRLREKAKQLNPRQKRDRNRMLFVYGFVFALVIITWFLAPHNDAAMAKPGTLITFTTLVAFLAALVPTTTGGLFDIINIAALERLVQQRVIPLSDRAVEMAEQVDVLLLEKEAVIIPGYRQAVTFIPLNNTHPIQLAEAVRLVSLVDEAPEGGSIIALAEKELGGEIEHTPFEAFAEIHPISFNAETGLSGVDIDRMRIRKGSPEAITAYVRAEGHAVPPELHGTVEQVANQGGVPLVVALNGQAVGVIHLQDLVNRGLKKRLIRLRREGIKTVLITGDTPLAAATQAIEAGTDDFLDGATPESQLALICRHQANKHLVAVTNQGTNELAILQQADLIVALNRDPQPVSETANMVALDNSPTKLIDIVENCRQRRATRKALARFSLTNDIAKYFVLISAFALTWPGFESLNILHLATPMSAILATIIFNALSLSLLTPLAWHGLPFRPVEAAQLRRDHLLIYGWGGLIAPFIGIKVIDLILTGFGLI